MSGSDKRRGAVLISFEALRRALWIDESFEISAIEVCAISETMTVTLHGDGLAAVAPQAGIPKSDLSSFQKNL